MHLIKWGVKPRIRKSIACMVALVMFLSILGLSNPGAALAKSTDSPPAQSLAVNINDNGEIIPIHTYTMAEMQALSGGVVYYSSIDSLPAPVITIAQGVTLNNLVADMNSKYNANVTMGSGTLKSIRLHATDAYSTEFTYDYLYGAQRSYYPRLVETWDEANNKTGEGCTDNPSPVDPLFAVSSYQARNLTNLDSNQMVGPTDEGSITFRFCFGQTADDISNSKITTGRFGKWVNQMDINLPDGPDAPTLTPDSTDNTVGNAAEITFTDDPTWRNAVSIVRVNGVNLTTDQYTKTEGKIIIAGSVFTEAKDYAIYLKAGNYKAATVTQTINQAPVQADLIVDGPKVAQSKAYTVAELKNLEKDTSWPPAVNDKKPVIQSKYSAIDAAGRHNKYSAEGVRVKYLLEQAGVQPGYGKVTFHSSDGWTTILTEQTINDGERYYYPYDNTLQPVAVEPILAYQSGKWTTQEADLTQMWAEAPLRLFLGQNPETEVNNNNFAKKVVRMEVGESQLAPPVLTADSSDNNIGNPLEISFTDDEAWRNAITEVKVDDTVLDAAKYTRTEAGKITIAADVFTTAKDYSIVVKAANYNEASVTQNIQAPVQADLIVDGPKVAQSKAYTVAELKNLEKDTSWPPTVNDKKPVIQSKYSAIDAAGRHNKYSAEGVRVKYLLEQAGVQPGYGKVTFHSSDGWTTILTEQTINDGERYYYPYDNTLQPVAVEPMLAYQSGKWTTQEADLTQMWAEAPLRLFLGQNPETEVNNNNFAKKVVRMEVGESQLAPPVLTADSSDNNIGNPIEISFTNDEAWRNAITEVKVDDTVLDAAKYTRTEAGKITIAADVFTTTKDYSIVVKAANYNDAAVTQTIQAGQAEIVFTINGDAVATNTYTMADLQAMSATEGTYPSKSGTVNCKGVALKDLLTLLNITDGSLIAQINITDAAAFPIDPVTVADLLKADNAYLLTYFMDGNPVAGGETPLRIYKAAESPKAATIKNVYGITISNPANPGSPPALTADSTDNIVGNAIEISFTDDEAWRNAITEVKVDDTVLDAAKYTKADSKITLDASVFTAAGIYTIAVKANGYQDASLTQTVNNEYATTALIIKVDNGSPVTVTAEQIKSLNPNNTLRYYSFAKDGKMNYYTGLGTPLAAILSQYASINSSDVQSMTVRAADYYKLFEDPQNELFNTRYYYPAVGDGVPVDSIIATDAQEYVTDDIGKLDNTNTMRLMMGQSSADERTNSWMVKWVCEIDITTFAATNVPVSGVSLNKTKTSLVINNSEQLTATITPPTASNKVVSWKSDKEAVATVDNTGKITAVGEGQAVITATTADGSFAADCTVTVLQKAPSPVYTVTPLKDAIYTIGTTPDGIWTMTVNSGNTGFNHFAVFIAPVVAHDGKETMVFTHLRDGAQLELNATEADFDVVNSAQAGFNVQAGDVIKVYPVDRLSNDGSNPFILQ